MIRRYTILFTAIICLPAFATIINIPDDYLTIQQGIDASSDGDTVLVQPGTYVENINFNGHNIVLGSLFLTTGDTSYISETIIDGDSSGSVVTFESGEDSTASIIGFTIKNGIAEHGGGVHCFHASPVIRNNIIINNQADQGDAQGGGIFCFYSDAIILSNIIEDNVAFYWYLFAGFGGGIYCTGSDPTVRNNTVKGNVALYGGGMFYYSSNPNIVGNTIEDNIVSMTFGQGGDGGGILCYNSNPVIFANYINDNYSENYGGGIYCTYSNPLISQNIIAENVAFSGGGIECHQSDPVLTNNIIINNHGYASGGGVRLQASNAIIINCTFTDNSSASSGGGIVSHNSEILIKNTIFWADTARYFNEIFADPSSNMTIIYSDIQDTLWPGDGNISADPMFVEQESSDFHLMSTECGDPFDSPCIDSGNPAIIDSLLDCSWGLGTILSDMGAYGGGDSVTVGIDFPDIPSPEEFSISQNYPNPFNAMTVIRYNLPEPSNVIIEIYDILGRQVETLVQGERSAGYHHVIWDAKDRPSGMYFYRIQAGDHSETRKMLLIK